MSGHFEGIDRNVRDVAELAVRVAEASTEQASGMGRAASAIGGMQAAVSDTAAFAEESAAVAEEMTAQAHEMQNLVSKFHLREDTGESERNLALAEAAATTPPNADPDGFEDF